MKCLMDLDGVIIDFVRGWEQHTGAKAPNPWPSGMYDMPTVYGWREEDFFAGIDEDFWINLEFMPDGKQILAVAEAYYNPSDICLISRTPYYAGYHAMGASGKIGWIEKNMPEYLDRFLLGPAKHFLATPSNILIDDCDDNINTFRSNGGHGIVLPRQWNTRFSEADNAPQALSNSIASYMRNR